MTREFIFCTFLFLFQPSIPSTHRPPYEKNTRSSTTCDNCFSSVPARTLPNTHSGGAPCACSVSGKEFVSKVPKEHTELSQRAHTMERSYACTVCGKRFTRADSKRRHELPHRRRRTHVCPVCDRCFTRADHVKRHQRVHTRKRPSTCRACVKGFSHPESLKCHMRTHTVTL